MARTKMTKDKAQVNLTKARPSLRPAMRALPKAKPALRKTKAAPAKVTKKVISKAVKKPALSAEEKARQKEERERLRTIRLALKEEKARIREEKERIKQEKLRMWELVPTNSVPIVKTNPLLSKGTSVRENPTSGCCLFCNNRECLQAAIYKDLKALKALLADTATISNPFQKLSVNNDLNLLKASVTGRDFDAFKLVIDYLTRMRNKSEKPRVKLPQIALTKKGTGSQNRYQHNFPMRQVNLSRGGKEGNNAFTHDNKLRKRMQIDFHDVLKLGASMSFVKYMLSNAERSDKSQASGPCARGTVQNFIPDKRKLAKYWAKAVRKGNFALVKYILEENKRQQMIHLSRLHQAAILQGKEATEVRMLNRNALLKQSNDEHQLVPSHIACINPDPSILQHYFRMYPTALQLDAKGRDLIHYAVMNVNPEVLNFLVSKRQMVNNADNDGMTPLMLACKYGKESAVSIIIDDQIKQRAQLDKKDDDYEHYAKFYSYVDSVGPYKNTPLHFAMRSGSLKIVKALFEAEACVDGKNFYNDTPLSVACELGHLEIAQYLVKQGANIHGVDKQQRTPLIRACQNGQVHVVAMLLRHGVNVNFCDLSGNTAIHYACAYGWLNVVKLLVDSAHADINRLNEWKSSPTIIAMLKGHFGIVDFLLSQSSVDASLVDDQGQSLVAQLCLHLNEDSFKNLKFLVSKNKIDVGHKTIDGYSPLHILACNDVQAIAKEAVQHVDEIESKPTYFMRGGKRIKVNPNRYNRWRNNQFQDLSTYLEKEEDRKDFEKLRKQLSSVQIQCAKLLIQHGCKVDDQTLGKKDGEKPSSALFFAVQSNSYNLAEFLLSKATSVAGGDDCGNNILHAFAEDFLFYAPSVTKILKLMTAKMAGQLKQLAQEENDEGLKPFHRFFTFLLDKFDSYNFLTHCLARTFEQPKDFTMQILTETFSSLEQLQTLFAEKLSFDISTRIGIPKHLKEEALLLVQQGGIKKQVYDKLIRLELDACDKNALDKQKDDSKIEYGVSGFAMDPKKKNLGIQTIKEDDRNENGYSNKKYKSRKLIRRKKGRARRTLTSDSEEDEDDDEDDEESQKSETFNAKKYYDEENTLKNVVMLIIKMLRCLNTRKDRGIDEQCNKNVTRMLESQITSLLSVHEANFSGKVSNGRKQKKNTDGFNKPDRKGETVLAKALKHKLISLSRLMISSGKLDLSAQQRSTGLAPMHLIANYIDDVSTVVEIFKVIEKRHVNVLDKFGNTPLHNAALCRNLPMCQMLCEVGGLSVNAENRFGCTPLHMSLFAFNEKKDHSPALERYLLAQGANPLALDSDKRTPLVYLFFKNRMPELDESADPAGVLQAFMDNATLTKSQLGIADRTGNTVLHYACMAGATICAMNLISAGCDTRKLNDIGNSPFSMALAHNQQQICTFMLPNGHGEAHPVNFLDQNDKQDALNKVKGLIVPKELHTEWFVNRGAETSTDTQMIALNYSQSMETPFFLAMEQGWDGIGFLLLSLRQDRFEALIGCLKAQKFGKFTDLLESVSKEITTQTDKKGRNLLLILMRNIGTEIKADSQEFTKVLQIVKLLTSSPLKKALLAAQQSGYGLSLSSSDSRGYNMMHILAKHSSIAVFEAIIKSHDGPVIWRLFSQASTTKVQAAPLVLLALEIAACEKSGDSARFVDLLVMVQTKLGAKAFYALPWTFVEENKVPSGFDDNLVIPDYLDFDKDLISAERDHDSRVPQLKHIVSIFMSNDFKLENNDEKLCTLYKLCDPFLNYKNPKSGETLLISLVKSGCQKQTFDYLLGATFNDEKKNFFFGARSQPRVNLDAQDKSGRTALHYVIQPSDQFAGKGCRQDTSMIKSLLARGASTTVKDRNGVSPLDIAKRCKTMLELLSPTAQRPATLVKQPKTSHGASVDRPYTADADAFLEAQMERIKGEKMSVDFSKPKCAVDDHEDLKTCEVVESDLIRQDGTKIFYDTVMIKVDVKASYYSIDAFYLIQLLHDRAKDLYILWTRWGRIGDFGQYQRTPFPSLLAAQMEFSKVFRQKSCNKWDDVLEFEAIPKKYKLRRLSGMNVYLAPGLRCWQAYELDIDMSKVLVNFAEHTNLRKTCLTQAQHEFIKPLVDSAYVLRRLKKQHLSDNLVFEGLLDRSVLQRLHQLLLNMLELANKQEKAQKNKSFQEFSDAVTKLFDYANQYFELSTPTEFAFDKMSNIHHEREIVSQIEKIQRLRDLEHASQLLMAAAQNIKSENPYDFCFRMLSCQVNVLDQHTDSYKLLMRYINAGLSRQGKQTRKYNLANIYEVSPDRNQPEPALFNDVHQHTMLFHGTSKANLLSILEQGVQIKPTNAACHNGSAFGEGIYLADDFMLAANYSEEDKEQTFYVLVCEVALGNVMNSLIGDQNETNAAGYFVDGSDDFARGYHSVRIMGEHGPDFNKNWIQESSDVIWPIGNQIDYEEPVWKARSQDEQGFSTLKEIVATQKPKKKKKPAKKKPAKKAKKGSSDSDDESMDSDGDDSDDDITDKDEKLANQVTKPKAVNIVMSSFEPNVVHHFSQGGIISEHFNRQNFEYNLNESQYVIANADQVRVRYIVQVEKVSKSTK